MKLQRREEAKTRDVPVKTAAILGQLYCWYTHLALLSLKLVFLLYSFDPTRGGVAPVLERASTLFHSASSQHLYLPSLSFFFL